ncbi:hypothetical protein [Allohahella marinimesophila]|uniref:ABC-type transport auxiliary lipoprotein component domain-containing protein n=1 Tax=Allohahella marinimesophila TaxID=1054972 RepID=A0ABP7NTB8_9GAMM
MMKNKHSLLQMSPRIHSGASGAGVLVVVALTCGLNACTNLLNAEPPVVRRYTLLATPAVEAGTPTNALTNSSIMVHVGSVGLSLNTDRVLARDELTIAPISDLRWVEAAPDMLEKSLTDFLQQSGQFRYVTHHRGGPKTDRILTVDLRDLYVISEDGQAKAVQFGLAARLSPESAERKARGAPVDEMSVVLNERVDIKRTEGQTIDKAIALAFSTAAQQAFSKLLKAMQAE